MISRRVLLWFAAGSVLAPVPLAVLVALGRLLTAMGDAGGGRAADIAAGVIGIVWVIGLILLLLAVAGYLLFPPEDSR